MKIRNQTGFTLVELIAVMGALSVVMGIAVTLLFQMFDLQMQCEAASEQTRSTNRLVAAFRQDIQIYGKPDVKTGAVALGEKLLRWTVDGKTLEYELLNGQHPRQRLIRRTEKTGKNTLRVEDYALSDGTVVYVFKGENMHAGLVALSIWQQIPGVEPPKANELNPFEQSGSADAGMGRTVLARFRTENKTEGQPQ